MCIASFFQQQTLDGLAGEASDRWFDKSLNFIWYENGLDCSNCDHTPMEAMTLVSMTYFVDLMVVANQGKWKGSTTVRSNLPEPSEVTIHVDDDIKQAINSAREEHAKIGGDLDVRLGKFTGFGKDELKKVQIHPDTAVQLALQLAYRRLHGKPAPTYETATTRRFYQARTETLRSCTPEVQRWCDVMISQPQEEELCARELMSAYTTHMRLMKEACNGYGIDRHLLGLYMMAAEKGLETPALFTDPAYTKSGGGGNYVLSTSFIGFTTVAGGVMPMCGPGYGTFYRFGSDFLMCYLSAWRSNPGSSSTEALFEHLTDALHDLLRIATVAHRLGYHKTANV